MKMLSPHLKLRKRVLSLLGPVVPVAVVMVLVAGHIGVPTSAATVAHAVAAPLWRVRDAAIATVVATYESLDTSDALVRENQALHDELSALRRENFMARAVVRDTAALRALARRREEQALPAAVLNSDAYAPYSSFVVDVGTAGGAREGMLVTSPEGVALGSVRYALERTSVVESFAAPGVATDVIVQATSSVHARMEGYGGGTMRLTVPRDLPVAVGDAVVLPDFAGDPIGAVRDIEVSVADPYQVVYVESGANLYELRYVLLSDVPWQSADANSATSTSHR